ncbi:MAG: fibronectin type III domain-containing protein, partial [Defluviitaleaceae bacterium]|nr:fibronectin type III domain-containing protein [Defluviitaleaceae bacterium]
MRTNERLYRAVWIWTDLSGEVSGATGDPADVAFLTNVNVNAGAIIRTDSLDPVDAAIPLELLYLPAAGGNPEQFAQYIYLLVTQGTTGGVMDLGTMVAGPGLFRQDITNAITRARLILIEPPAFSTNISLNPGVNETEMRFSWWTPRGQATSAQVQLADNAAMTGATVFTGAAPFPIPATLPGSGSTYDVNRVVVTGLTPNTRYYYQVGDPNNWSEVQHFYTFNPSVTGMQTILIAGDPQMGGSPVGLSRQIDKMTDSLERGIARAAGVGHGGVDFILSTGDNVGGASNRVDRWNAFMATPVLRNIPLFTTIGNHDSQSQATGADFNTPLSLSYFMSYWPNHQWLGSGGPNAPTFAYTNANLLGGGNHFFRYGDVLYISLNTNDRTFLAQHRPIFEAAVAAHPDTTWRIVTFHQNIFGGGNFHSPAMPASGWWRMLEIFEEFDVDLVINGHDHTHGRSFFMTACPDNQATPVRQQMPADFGRNRDELLVHDAHPGAFIAPEGIPFITIASISDFPKYTAFQPMLPWVAWVDPAQYDNYSQYSILVIDGDSLTIQTFAVPYNTSLWIPSGAPEIMTNSFTIRQTARFEDLQNLIAGIDSPAFTIGDITPASWADLMNTVDAARPLTAASPAAAINDAFSAIYEAYFDLENDADFTALADLLAEAEAVLLTAVYGPWYGQFPDGTIATFRTTYFEPAELVNSIRLSTQASIDAQYNLLRPAFEAFLALASTIPRPWTDVHSIPATGVYTMGLLDWMFDGQPMNPECPRGQCLHPCWLVRPWECSENVTPRFFSHFTKINFAGGSLYRDHVNLQAPRDGAPVRPDQTFGPVNTVGGRLPIPFGYYPASHANAGQERFTSGHVARTHAGEWIRYELNVAQAGMYRVHLGAINPSATNAMEVRLRDTDLNTLTRFIVPAGHGAAGWTAANPLIEAEDYIFLPQGNFVLEMLFINDRTRPTRPGASGTPAFYADGVSVDIMTLERVGAGTAPVFDIPAYHVMLPLPAQDAAGMSHRQRGWS